MAANCNYKVKLIGALDMLRFKNMPKVREAAIQAAPATPLPKTFTTNEKAKVRHPEMQRVVVAEIRPNGPDVKTIVLKSEDGAPLAPFRAGQYVSVTAHIGETVTTRAYSLSGSPAWAKRGEYNIAVRRGAVDLICARCGGRLRLNAATDRDLDDLCCQMKLTIPGK